METKARRLTELIAARDELTRRYADVRRKHNDARTAVLAAASGGIGSHVPLRDAGAAAPLTLAQLAEWAKQCEAEAAEIRELLTQVDVRIAEVSAQALGYAH